MRKVNLSIWFYTVLMLVQAGCGATRSAYVAPGQNQARAGSPAGGRDVFNSPLNYTSPTEPPTQSPTPVPTSTPVVVATPSVTPAPPAPVAFQASVSGLSTTQVEVVVGPKDVLADLVSSPRIGFYVSGNLPIHVAAITSTNNWFQIARHESVNANTSYIEGYWFATGGNNGVYSIYVDVTSGTQARRVTVSTNLRSRFPSQRPVYLSVSPVNGDNLYSLSSSEGPAAGYTPQNRAYAFQVYSQPVVTSVTTADVPLHRCRFVNAPDYHFVNKYNCGGHYDEGVLGYAWRVGPEPLNFYLPGGTFFRIYRVYRATGPRSLTDYNTWYSIGGNPQWGFIQDTDLSVLVLN